MSFADDTEPGGQYLLWGQTFALIFSFEVPSSQVYPSGQKSHLFGSTKAKSSIDNPST